MTNFDFVDISVSPLPNKFPINCFYVCQVVAEYILLNTVDNRHYYVFVIIEKWVFICSISLKDTCFM